MDPRRTTHTNYSELSLKRIWRGILCLTATCLALLVSEIYDQSYSSLQPTFSTTITVVRNRTTTIVLPPILYNNDTTGALTQENVTNVSARHNISTTTPLPPASSAEHIHGTPSSVTNPATKATLVPSTPNNNDVDISSLEKFTNISTPQNKTSTIQPPPASAEQINGTALSVMNDATRATLPSTPNNNDTDDSSLETFTNASTPQNNTSTNQPPRPTELPAQQENVPVTPVVAKARRPPFVGGEWNDEGMHFEITPEQERLFQGFSDGRGGATTCPWNRNESYVSQECEDLLAPITQNVRLWYFIGDSTMAHPFRYCLVPKLANHSKTLKSALGKRAGAVVQYIGVAPEERLTQLKPVNYSMGEGPTFATLYKPGCSSCENRLLEFVHKGPTSEYTPSNHTSDDDGSPLGSTMAYAEFLNLEFARDFIFATTATETTQDTIAQYMRRQTYDRGGLSAIPKNQTACVISSGMHDLTIPDLKSDIYIANHVAMKRLLKDAGCDIWIKLELTAKGYKGPVGRENAIIFEWNQGIRESMEPDEYQINLFARSLNSKHGDDIHMDKDTFYCPLMDFFIDLMGVDTTVTMTS